jgi:hypothetical protein
MPSELDLRVLGGECSAHFCGVVRRSVVQNQNAHVHIALIDDALHTAAEIAAVFVARDHNIDGWNRIT